MIERPVTFTSSGVHLAGTLAHPDGGGPFPGVLMIPGSGPVDRDENHRHLRSNVLREVAEQLVDSGCATLRYDKRGVGASEGDFWTTGFHDNVSDARAALAFLADSPIVDPRALFLLGHSEGSLISLSIAVDNAQIRGLVLLCPALCSGEELLLRQAVRAGQALRGAAKMLTRVLGFDPVRAQNWEIALVKQSSADWLWSGRTGEINAKWLREFLAYEPAEDLEKVRAPMLAITGSNDLQVDPDDLALMAKRASAPFEWHVVPGVTHILRVETGVSGLGGYRQQVLYPVDPRVLSLIADWLQTRLGWGRSAAPRESPQPRPWWRWPRHPIPD